MAKSLWSHAHGITRNNYFKKKNFLAIGIKFFFFLLVKPVKCKPVRQGCFFKS
jgi:hypothetical protein